MILKGLRMNPKDGPTLQTTLKEKLLKPPTTITKPTEALVPVFVFPLYRAQYWQGGAL